MSTKNEGELRDANKWNSTEHTRRSDSRN